MSTSGTIKLYNHEFPVAAQLTSTGTSLDNSVFVNSATIPDVISYSAQTGHAAIPQEYASQAVSAVLVKTSDIDAKTVAANIADTVRKDGVTGLGYVYPGGVTASTKSNLDALMGYAGLFLLVFWAMGLIVLLTVFASTTNDRKREFATYRIMGATRSMLVGIIMRESVAIGLCGGVIGIVCASLAILPFNTLIGSRLQLPYLQTGVITVLVLIAIGLVFAVITGVVASVISAVKLSTPETYLTLREGE